MKSTRSNLLMLSALVLTCSSFNHMVQAQSKPGDPKDKRVLIIGIDGTRPDALAKATTPNLDDLIQKGAFTDSGQILGLRYQGNNTISGPGWSSILTGVWADKHGVHDNGFKGRNFELFPHFFKYLKRVRPDATTVSLVSWPPIDEFIVSEADVREVIPMQPGKNSITDFKVSADSLDINTRDGKWHHLLAVREGGELRMYLDGRQAGIMKTANDTYELEGEYYYIGRDTRSGKTCMKGEIDDVRLWKRALSNDEIQTGASGASPANRESLFAEYLFENEGTTSGSIASILSDTARNAEGPFPATAVSKTEPITLSDAGSGTTDSTRTSRALSLPAGGAKDHGVRIQLTAPIKSITQGDFTIEARFRCQDPGRNILLGNFSGKSGALNLELHAKNSIRLYQQPPKAVSVQWREKENERDDRMAQEAARILTEQDPTAMFIYFHQVDANGHAIGFSPDVPEYVNAIENVDGHIGTVIEALRSRPKYADEDWLVLVCTDHGGAKKSHSKGHQIPEIRTVFMIVSGPAAEAGRIEKQAYLVDIAATALAHLAGPLDDEWQLDGRPIGLKQVEKNR